MAKEIEYISIDAIALWTSFPIDSVKAWTEQNRKRLSIRLREGWLTYRQALICSIGLVLNIDFDRAEDFYMRHENDKINRETKSDSRIHSGLQDETQREFTVDA